MTLTAAERIELIGGNALQDEMALFGKIDDFRDGTAVLTFGD